jgi:peptidoglycan-associated lipoprotein
MQAKLMVLALVTMAAACATAEKKPVALTPTTAPTTAAPKTAAATSSSSSANAASDAARPQLAPLYFAFDDSQLQSQSQESLQRLAGYLVKHPETRILVEGNTDEVGTAEYNLALGQRRANAALDYLMRLGVKKDQIRTISYGEERPAAQGTGESIWAQNRRDEVKPGS